MRLCTKCNRLLKNSDAYCPYCAQEAAAAAENDPKAKSGAEQLPEPMEALRKDSVRAEPPAEPTGKPESAVGVSFTMEIPFSAFAEQPQIPEEAPEPERKPAAAERVSEPHEVTMEFPAAADPADDGILDERDFQRGHIEREMDDVEVARSGRIGKLGITLIAILVLAALTFGFLIYLKASAPPPEPTDASMISMVAGTWVSDRFTYSDSEETQYVELLMLGITGEFNIRIMEVNKTDPDGYLDGTWVVTQEFSGSYEARSESKDLILKYRNEAAEEQTLIRNIQKMTDDMVTLREYYNEARTDYYDLSYTKIN